MRNKARQFLHGKVQPCSCCHCGYKHLSTHTVTMPAAMQVVRTVSSVLEDMKKKYELAARQSLQARNQESRSMGDMLMIKKAQEIKMTEIKHLCRCLSFCICLQNPSHNPHQHCCSTTPSYPQPLSTLRSNRDSLLCRLQQASSWNNVQCLNLLC